MIELFFLTTDNRCYLIKIPIFEKLELDRAAAFEVTGAGVLGSFGDMGIRVRSLRVDVWVVVVVGVWD